jgi:hypothetical protein
MTEQTPSYLIDFGAATTGQRTPSIPPRNPMPASGRGRPVHGDRPRVGGPRRRADRRDPVRRLARHVAPLVREAFDWTHGVFLGASMSSEKTAAASGTIGERNHLTASAEILQQTPALPHLWPVLANQPSGAAARAALMDTSHEFRRFGAPYASRELRHYTAAPPAPMSRFVSWPRASHHAADLGRRVGRRMSPPVFALSAATVGLDTLLISGTGSYALDALDACATLACGLLAPRIGWHSRRGKPGPAATAPTPMPHRVASAHKMSSRTLDGQRLHQLSVASRRRARRV